LPSASMVIDNGASDAVAAWNAWYPAIGTPIKLTRSLAEKAIARAKVPISTIGLKILIFKNNSSCKITTEAMNIMGKITKALANSQLAVSGGINDVPLAPLTKIK